MQTIHLDYPINPQPRYGHGKPPHERLYGILGAHREHYAGWLRTILCYAPALRRIPTTADEAASAAGSPQWVNDYLPGLDAAALYAFLAMRDGAHYMEIGSGNSTRFARRSIADNNLRTRITSIDPHPRAECDALCDRVVRQPVEELDLALFDELGPGDVLFVDHSHRVFTNSDTVVTFLEILPRLRPGVLVQFHDIWLPYDYPPEWNGWFFAEQYMLACWLLAGTSAFDIVMANGFCSNDADLLAVLAPLWDDPMFAAVSRGGGSFWIETRAGEEPARPFRPPEGD